ncbi:hypothetical protein ACS0TY_030094 [Phlomoides rotata]
MGCFFGCFRVKDSSANLVTPSEPVAPRSKNALSSLFVTDDESLGKGEEGEKQLEEEAKFFKARGTFPKTPIKFQNALEKWEEISALNEAGSPMPGSASFMDSPSSCMTDGHNTQRASSSSAKRRDVQNVDTPMVMCDSQTRSEISSVSTEAFLSSVQCKKKSVQFNCAPDSSALSSNGSSSECVSPHSKQLGSTGGSLTYPTSVEIPEEMQTPDTMFPGYRSSVLDPAENPSNELKDESSDSNLPSESVKLNDEDNMIRKEEMKVDESLSSWFKPVSAKQDDNNKRFSSFAGENVHRRKVPVDRPILGMVAAHWNDVDDDETSHISPKCKWWDGNGIPNSTNKYKEDQKVSWHATPFEERLEKALSEETFLSQKKPINRTPSFSLDETEESDTAISQMRSSTHLKSVVSF